MSFVYYPFEVEQVDHAAEAEVNALWWYQGLPRFMAVLSDLMSIVDEIEDVAIDILGKYSPYSAEGDQLDILGKIVGQQRGELIDQEYRLFILAKIYANKSKGWIEDFIYVLNLLNAETVVVREKKPACFEIEATDLAYAKTVGKILDLMKPIGVRMDFVYLDELRANMFQAAGGSSYATGETDANRGAGAEPYDSTTGGKAASLYQ